MSKLDLYLLGPPRIERDGVPVHVDTRKATALLAYLAVTGERHSRDVLATLLWQESDQSRARGALRRTLSALNKALDGDGLRVERDSVMLERVPSAWVDVEAFHDMLAACREHGHSQDEACASCLPPLSRAVELYRGDFLAGFALRDSSDFDDWQFFQAEGLRQELAGVLGRLVRAHSARGEFEQAIGYGRRWLSLDQMHEPAHRRLMELYYWSGQRNAALRQYRECMRVLEQELGVPPLEETTRLYEAIKEDHGPPPPARVPADVTADTSSSPAAAPAIAATSALDMEGKSARFPMVGRSAALSAMLDLYAGIEDDGRLILIEGEPGIGKTRLAQEFVGRVQSLGATVIAARCYEGEAGLAYAPFTQALRNSIGLAPGVQRLDRVPAHWAGEAVRLLPELTSLRSDLLAPPPLDSPGAQVRFFEGISEVLLALSDYPPAGVLALDDLHWADDSSIYLLTYLVRRLGGRPLCVLASWRSDQVPGGHPLRQLSAEAQRDGRGTTISLSRLSQMETAELVSTASGSGKAPSDDVITRLYSETEGNPFFLVEYLTAFETRALAEGDWSMPPSVRDLLDSRVASISGTGRQLLSTAAVIGRSFDFDTLREASGRSEEETIAGLEVLLAEGLVEEISSGDASGPLVYDFTHEKLRTLVQQETSLARRRLLHRRVAEALAARAGRRGQLDHQSSQIAQHYQQAGQEPEAAQYFKRAGDHARSLYANAEALAHYRSALALGHPDTAALHEAIGDLQTLSGEYAAALTSYEMSAAMCEPEALPGIEHKLGNVRHRRGEWELAESHFQAALGALPKTASMSTRARVLADWSLTAHRSGQSDKAKDLASEALEVAESAGDLRALAQVHNILGVLAKSRDALDEAVDQLESSLSLAESLGDPGARVAAMNNLALAFGAVGEVDRGMALAEAALEVCASQGDRHREAALHNNMADLLHVAGRTEEAMSHLKRAVTIFSEIGSDAGTMQPEVWKLIEW